MAVEKTDADAAFLKILKTGIMPTAELVKEFLARQPHEREAFLKQLHKRVKTLAETEAPKDEIDEGLLQTVFTGASEEEIAEAVELSKKSARQPLFAEPIRFTIGRGEIDYSAASVKPANEVAGLVRKPLHEHALEILREVRVLGPKIRTAFARELGPIAEAGLEKVIPKTGEARLVEILAKTAKMLYASYHEDRSARVLDLADKASFALANHENPEMMQASGHALLLNSHELVTDRLHDVRGRILLQLHPEFLKTVERHPVGRRIVAPRLRKAIEEGRPVEEELRKLLSRVKRIQAKAVEWGPNGRRRRQEFLRSLVSVVESSWSRLHPVSDFAAGLTRRLAAETSKIRVSAASGKDEVALVASNKSGDRLVKHSSDDCLPPKAADLVDNVRVYLGGKWAGNLYTATGRHDEKKVLLVDALQMGKKHEINHGEFVKKTISELWKRAKQHGFGAIIMSSKKAFWSNRKLLQNAVKSLYPKARKIRRVKFDRRVSQLQSVKHGEFMVVAGRA